MATRGPGPGVSRTAGAHVAVLLAAGGSTRLGQPKQLLRRDGETLLRRSARLLDQTRPLQLIVVLGAEHERMRASLAGLACRVVINADWRQGLAGSLDAAAPLVPEDASALVAVCDQPALALAQLHALLEGARVAASRCAATDTGAALGVPAVVPGAWFGEPLSSAGHGFGRRLRALAPGALFRLPAPTLALDIDTPQDLRQAIAAGWLDGGAAAC